MAPNFVYDNLPVPGVKTDNPEQVVREASVPTNQKTTAAEVNELTAAATGLRTAVNEVAPFYNVMRYANGAPIDDGVTDATVALEAMLAAAGAAAMTVGGLARSTPEAVIPAGGFAQSRPLILPGGVTVRGSGPGATVLTWAPNTWGYSFLAGDDDNGANSLHFTTAFGGSALVCDYASGDASTHSFVDLSQYTYGRLPAGSWTIRFARRFTNVATVAPDGIPILFIGALTPWSDFPIPATALSLYFDLFAADGSLRLDYRFHNVLTTVTAPFTGTPILLNNTWYEFEIAYDDAAGTLRVFCNGELWTRGALALSGAGPNADSTKLRQWAWERLTIGSTIGGGFPTEDQLFPSPLGAIKGFHLRDGVAHTANYTAFPLVDPTGGVSTFFLCNFNQVYKGHLVAKGINNTTTVYLRPVRNGSVSERPRIQVRDLTVVGGGGMRFEFASESLVENVVLASPSAGLELVRNCFFTHLARVRVLNGLRAGILDLAGSYESFTGINASCAIGFALYEANVALVGCTTQAHTGGVLGMVVAGGTCSALGFSVDNEENVGSGPWIAALMLKDTITFDSVNATLYNPPDKQTKSPVLIRNTGAGTGYHFLGGFFQDVPSNVALTALVGSLLELGNKISIAGASNGNASPLCSVAGQAHDPYSTSPTILAGLSGTDKPAQNLGGSLVFGPGDTFLSVVFAVAEPDAAYVPVLTPGVLTGSPSVTFAYWQNRSTTGFDVVIPNPPGGGDSISVSWFIFRAP